MISPTLRVSFLQKAMPEWKSVLNTKEIRILYENDPAFPGGESRLHLV